MKVGIPSEVKNNEFRVAITPAGANELRLNGHDVYVERAAGLGSSITDAEYAAAGATILETADEYFPYSTAKVPGQGRWQAYGLELPDDVLEKVYHLNAERIVPGLG